MEAIRAYHEAIYNQFTIQINNSVDEVRIFGKWGFAQRTYSGTLSPKDGEKPIHENGKALTIVQRMPDGSWKISHDIWNANN